VGQQFGNYRLVRLLGRGGFAEVYLGQHVRLSTQQAALKILSQQLGDAYVQAFEREAETIAALVHPNIVRILDFDIADATPFLVMDYAPNGSLRRQHAPGEQVLLPVVVSYVQQVAEGLQYAHDHKIIHRDIKPDNMLIGVRHEIVLSDFGIATIAHSTTSQSTQAAIGTIPYMAPEQMQEYPRPASDQYALAISAYEWLAGERPFGGTFTEIAVKHAMVPPPSLHLKRPDLPWDVGQVIMTALAKDPKARFGGVQAFARALASASGSQVAAAAQPLPATQLARPALAPTQPVAPAPALTPAPIAFHRPDPPGVVLDLRASGSVNSVTWAPDSQHVVLGARNGTAQIWNVSRRANVLTYLGHTARVPGDVNSVTWSPDGRWIASASDDQSVQVWNAYDGRPAFVYRRHLARVWSVVWSPDGSRLASAGSDGTAQIWQAFNGRGVLRYAGHEDMPVFSLAWSPDGEWLASGADDGTVQVWSALDGMHLFNCQEHSGVATSIAWSPDGEWLASGTDDGSVRVWDAGDGAHAFTRQHTDHVECVAWSPDGRWLASGAGDQTVQIWDVTSGSCIVVYRAHRSGVNSLAWSPNGRRIASASDDGLVLVWECPQNIGP